MAAGVVALFVALWFATNQAPCESVDEVALRMCRDATTVWDTFRILVFWLPGAIVLVAFIVKLTWFYSPGPRRIS